MGRLIEEARRLDQTADHDLAADAWGRVADLARGEGVYSPTYRDALDREQAAMGRIQAQARRRAQRVL
jgi:hypothetical protein